MSEREELEAVIEGAKARLAGHTERAASNQLSYETDWAYDQVADHIREILEAHTALINSGYTKGNGEPVAYLRDVQPDAEDEALFVCAKGDSGCFPVYAAPVPDKGNGELVEPNAGVNRLVEAVRALSDSEEAGLSGRSGGDAAGRDVLAERARQKAVEGWSPEHDDEHLADELVGAAICYAATPAKQKLFEHFDGADLIGLMWPIGWDFRWFKPKGRRRDLVRASALIIAEIERLDRAAARSAAQDTQRAERATNGGRDDG